NSQPKRFPADNFRRKTFEATAKCRIARPDKPQAYQATPNILTLNKYHVFRIKMVFRSVRKSSS
ncbi:MAG: hypothetical protein JXR70_06505, partial [Spirochaetales bacterium]|nr:hypothetical protein [Spirochaetales bacterium]